jgi:hypothetical protein
MAIQFDNTNTGTVTLKPPSSGTPSFILPSSDGSNGDILTTDGSGQLSFTTPSSGGGGGTVQQIVYADSNSTISRNTTAYISSGVSQSITVGDAANKVMVRFTGLYSVQYINTAMSINFRLYRNGSSIKSFSGSPGYGYAFNNTYFYRFFALEWVDTPGAAGTYTYAFYFNRGSGYASYSALLLGTKVLTLMEFTP